MQRLIEFEAELAFRRDFHGLASGQDLCARACGSASCSTNRGTFSPSCNGADQSAKHRSATDHFRGALVCAKTFSSLLFNVLGTYRVTAASDFHRLKIKSEI